MNYIDAVYNEKDRPLTDYPNKLCSYLHETQLNTIVRNRGYTPSILDLGCGRGDFSRAFVNLGYQVLSYDQEYNDKYHCNLHYYDNRNVDVIFSKSVLEHVSNPIDFLNSWKEKLNTNGKIIILVPNWKSQYKIFYDDPTHIRPFTQEGLREAMVMAGFKNVHTEVFYQLPIVWKHEWMKYICKFISLFVKPEHYPKNKFLRWSTETMILGVGEKC